MKSYRFRILRYVHDVSTEEFVNIGVVMWVPEYSQLIFRLNTQSRRVSRFFTDFDSDGYRKMVRNLQHAFDEIAIDIQKFDLFKETPQNTFEIFNELVREDASCFQWSPLMSGISANPEERLERLFVEFVTFHESPGLSRHREETMIWDTVHQALIEHNLERRVQFKVKMEADNFEHQFKMGWNNGLPQVLEPISLTLSKSTSIVNKAITWSGRLFNLSKNNTFECTAVIAPRDEHIDIKAFNQGLHILKDAHSMRKVITVDEANDYMSEINKDLSS